MFCHQYCNDCCGSGAPPRLRLCPSNLQGTHTIIVLGSILQSSSMYNYTKIMHKNKTICSSRILFRVPANYDIAAGIQGMCVQGGVILAGLWRLGTGIPPLKWHVSSQVTAHVAARFHCTLSFIWDIFYRYMHYFRVVHHSGSLWRDDWHINEISK